jgi:hypothetical protein
MNTDMQVIELEREEKLHPDLKSDGFGGCGFMTGSTLDLL